MTTEPLDLAAMRELADEAEALSAKATPGPWFWNVSLKSKHVVLESHNRGGMLEIVMSFARWGMGGAKPLFLDQVKCLLVDSDKLTVKVPKREHHADWFQTIDHPDANFMAESRTLVPTLAAHVKRLAGEVERMDATIERLRSTIRQLERDGEATN